MATPARMGNNFSYHQSSPFCGIEKAAFVVNTPRKRFIAAGNEYRKLCTERGCCNRCLPLQEANFDRSNGCFRGDELTYYTGSLEKQEASAQIKVVLTEPMRIYCVL